VDSNFCDNEFAWAQLLYHFWRSDMDPLWENLGEAVQRRWIRLAVYVMNSEVELTARLADESIRKRIEERMLKRRHRWQTGQVANYVVAAAEDAQLESRKGNQSW
jgi:hypothetical protein